MKRIFLALIALFIFAHPVFPATYYVKNGGNNSLDGTSDGNAWETIAHVNDCAESAGSASCPAGFSDGDIIQFKRGDIWIGDETLGYDGSVINWGTINGLTIQDYDSGDKPKFDANSFQPIYIDGNNVLTNLTIKNINVDGMDWSGLGANVFVYRVANIVIDGIEGDGHTGASSYPKRHGIEIKQMGNGTVEVKNCVLSWFVGDYLKDPSWNSADGFGIHIRYINGGLPTTGVTVSVHDNTVHDVESDCIQVAGIYGTQTYYNNTFYNFGENAIDIKTGNGIEIYNNNTYRGTYGLGGSGGGLGNIVTHGDGEWPGYGVSNVNIHDNYFHDTYYMGVRLLKTGSATYTDYRVHHNYFESVAQAIEFSGITNLTFDNNLINMDENLNIQQDGLGLPHTAVWIYDAVNPNVKIYNNTFYITNSYTLYAIYHYRRTGTTVDLKNNIIQLVSSASNRYALYVDTATGDLPTVSKNIYHTGGTNRVYWAGTAYSSSQEAAFETASEGAEDTNISSFSNPGMNDPGNGDFSLYSNDPGFGTGNTTICALTGVKNGWSPSSALPTISTSVTTVDRSTYGQCDTGNEVAYYKILNASPVDDAVGISVGVVLEWVNPNTSPTVQGYMDICSEHNPPTTQVITDGADTESYDPPGSLTGNTEYCWKINLDGVEGDVYSFTTTNVSPPVSNLILMNISIGE